MAENNASVYFYKYTISGAPEVLELLSVLLDDMGVAGLEQQEDRLIAWLEGTADLRKFKARLGDWQQSLSFDFASEQVEEENWNARWEANFPPVIIGNTLLVRAPFHAPRNDVMYEILLEPRMAFGTGHHATTHLMLEAIGLLSMGEKKVLDFGCGTGILTIFASLRRASPITAIDIDPQAVNNSRENMAINRVEGVQLLEGGLEVLQDAGSFDLILANINKNVILDSLSSLYELGYPGALLLISGILQQDEQEVVRAALSAGFHKDNQSTREEWLCLTFKKPY